MSGNYFSVEGRQFIQPSRLAPNSASSWGSDQPNLKETFMEDDENIIYVSVSAQFSSAFNLSDPVRARFCIRSWVGSRTTSVWCSLQDFLHPYERWIGNCSHSTKQMVSADQPYQEKMLDLRKDC